MRRLVIWTLAALLAINGLLLGILLLRTDDSTVPANSSYGAAVAGFVTYADDHRVVLRTGPGVREQDFAVRDRDRLAVDPNHLRSHAALGMPTELRYVKERGTKFAVGQRDIALTDVSATPPLGARSMPPAMWDKVRVAKTSDTVRSLAGDPRLRTTEGHKDQLRECWWYDRFRTQVMYVVCFSLPERRVVEVRANQQDPIFGN